MNNQICSSRFASLYNLSLSDVQNSDIFQSLATANINKAELLGSIPATSSPSIRPIHLLYLILDQISGPWPTLDVIKCHTRVFKCLPERVKSGKEDPKGLVEATSVLIKKSYISFSQFIKSSDEPALRDVNPDTYITYRSLHHFVDTLNLPVESANKKPVVAIALPNGPLLAATCIAVTNYYTAAPINPAAGLEQFRSDVCQAQANAILTTRDEYQKLQLESSWVSKRSIKVFIVNWSGTENINVQTPSGLSLPPSASVPKPNGPDDVALTLFTSGTSGTKKVVPLTIHSIISGIAFVVDSWGLIPNDICVNMMPLYHIGGLLRNIFAPVFSGGSTVCCTTFDARLFWHLVDSIHPTWYYASPTMHSVILAEAGASADATQKGSIRLVCNAAGALLPTLSHQLSDTFGCVVLPSYGMTECMPISTPPLDYRLEREGTSGISTGPELVILDESDSVAPCDTVGKICVRGEPVFKGYLRSDGSYDKSCFNEDGWFDTGDLGYMDHGGYLYITGRSKEVINRGGELISPFEVENAIMSASQSSDSPIYGRVSQALAFSAPHDVLQEVVAVVLVTPPQAPRADLRALHRALKSSLQQAKWPTIITYMDDLPKSNNKILRIRLGQRLNLDELTDDTPYLGRHREAKCPPPGTALSVLIESQLCAIDYHEISLKADSNVPAGYRAYFSQVPKQSGLEAVLAPLSDGTPGLSTERVGEFRQDLAQSMDNYLIPTQIIAASHPLKNGDDGFSAGDLQEELDQILNASSESLESSTEGLVTKAFAEVLSVSPEDIPRDVDFFDLGGDSLGAGRLVSALRSYFNVYLPVSVVFHKGSVMSLATHIDEIVSDGEDDVKPQDQVVDCSRSYSSTNIFLMLIQLTPLIIIYPLRRAFQLTVFISILSQTQRLPTNNSIPGRMLGLVMAVFLSRIVVGCVCPAAAIIAKWCIIGRYKEGLHPMWGLYHTRWWLVQKIVSLCGKGMFNTNDWTRNLYYRLLGAKIGKDVKLNDVNLGEWDLVEIGDGTIMTNSICRPFAAERNATMYLGRIKVGKNCSAGICSIIAPGANMPDNTCLGHNSSSWEMQDADESYRDMLPDLRKKPHWLLELMFTIPLNLVAGFVSLLPWLAGLVGMVMNKSTAKTEPLRNILNWYTKAERVGYHYLALVLKCLFSSAFLFLFTVLVKIILDAIFGKLESSPQQGTDTISVWRANLMKTLLPESKLHQVTSLFGQHYETTSVTLRMLGAKVGKRVYWPGNGPSMGDYHLLEVGNDVVFGSRSHIVTSDAIGSEKVVVQDGAMVADRVCLLPGVRIAEHTTMGSGALTRRGNYYLPGSTYVGSKGGDAICLSTGHDALDKGTGRSRFRGRAASETLVGSDSDADRSRNTSKKDVSTNAFYASKSRLDVASDPAPSSDISSTPGGSNENASPFGRAFYLNEAPYHVLGPFAIFCYSITLTVISTIYWDGPAISSVQITNRLLKTVLPQSVGFWYELLFFFGFTFVTVAVLSTIQAVLALAIVIASKWAIIGRRMPGNYDWDKSSYCQRWQFYLGVERLQRRCYRGYGILGMLTGTHWIVLYYRALGAKIGKDCALFANGKCGLMFTEPDLITLGDRVVIDDASVVAHINTRGKFDLNQLKIEDRCVLRTGSRLLSGATMKKDSCLLEHTLVMGGDVVEENWTMQGWPAEKFKDQRVVGVEGGTAQ